MLGSARRPQLHANPRITKGKGSGLRGCCGGLGVSDEPLACDIFNLGAGFRHDPILSRVSVLAAGALHSTGVL